MNGDRAAREGKNSAKEKTRANSASQPCVLPQPRHPTSSLFGTGSLPPTHQQNPAQASPLLGSPPFHASLGDSTWTSGALLPSPPPAHCAVVRDRLLSAVWVLSPLGRGGECLSSSRGSAPPSPGLGSRTQARQANECTGKGMKEGRSG